jgi:hypothetical protein
MPNANDLLPCMVIQCRSECLLFELPLDYRLPNNLTTLPSDYFFEPQMSMTTSHSSTDYSRTALMTLLSCHLLRHQTDTSDKRAFNICDW